MLLREIGPLSRDYSFEDSWFTYDYRWALCDRGLRKFFYIDRNAKRIWVQIHDRPAKNRLKVTGNWKTGSREEDLGAGLTVSFGGTRRIATYTEWCAKPLAPYPYYVEIVQEIES